MKDDFRERLELYRAGKLDKEEAKRVEAEIERYAAIRDYLDDKEEEFLSGLKQELDRKAPAEKSMGRKINRKMLFKIVGLTLATLIACLIFIPVFRHHLPCHREEGTTAAISDLGRLPLKAG